MLKVREKYFKTSSSINLTKKSKLILVDHVEDSSNLNHNEFKSIVNVDFNKESYRNFRNYVKHVNKLTNLNSPDFVN